MDPTSPSKLMEVLLVFEQALISAETSIRTKMLLLLTLTVLLQLLWVAVQMLRGQSVVYEGMLLLVRTSLVVWLEYQFPSLLRGAIRWAGTLGLAVLGDSITVAQYLDPSAVLVLGLKAGNSLYGMYDTTSALLSPVLAITWLLTWLLYVAAFAYMAVTIFLWQVQALFAAAWAMALIPCLAFRGTAWIGRGTLSYLVNAANQFGLGALVIAVVFRLAPILQVPTTISFRGALLYMLAALTAATTLFFINKLASGLIQGIPALAGAQLLASAGAGVAAVSATVFGAGAVLAGGGALAAGSGRLGVATARQLAGTYTGLQQGSSLGSAWRQGYAGATAPARLTGINTRLASAAVSQSARTLRQTANIARIAHQDTGRGLTQ